MTITQAIRVVEAFQGNSLTKNLAAIEKDIRGFDVQQMQVFCADRTIDASFMASASSIKRMAGQINVIIHAAGILCSLQHILNEGEIVESVSLGAGNTGRQFDLETNMRVAEYKFIDWQGGAETIRQNALFKDFYALAEHQTTKTKHLYVLGAEVPLKFLRGGRLLTSVLSRTPSVLEQLKDKYGSKLTVVRDYYEIRKSDVHITDVSRFIGR